MIINDYNPIPSYQTQIAHLVEELFRIENTIYYIVEGEPVLVWYPSEYITDLPHLLD